MKARIKKIALLGASGHIAKSLIYNFAHDGSFEVILFARRLEGLKDFLRGINRKSLFKAHDFSAFQKLNYDAIINCVGMGTPEKVKQTGSGIFRLTEDFDNLILEYLSGHPETVYINFSSGVVHNIPKLDISNVLKTDYYMVAKLNSEVKHRGLNNLNIFDLRIFGFFSRFIDLNSGYLMSEIISCLKKDKKFITGPKDILRDYVHPRDLLSLIKLCISGYSLNRGIDVYSLKPIRKFEILEYFANRHGLKYVVKEGIDVSSATGVKNNYCAKDKFAKKLGYQPQFSSRDCIIQESQAMLSRDYSRNG